MNFFTFALFASMVLSMTFASPAPRYDEAVEFAKLVNCGIDIADKYTTEHGLRELWTSSRDNFLELVEMMKECVNEELPERKICKKKVLEQAGLEIGIVQMRFAEAEKVEEFGKLFEQVNEKCHLF